MEKQAIIYCRVSSNKQVREGHGLEGQEKRCRNYASSKGYSVIKVFKEERYFRGGCRSPSDERIVSLLRRNGISDRSNYR